MDGEADSARRESCDTGQAATGPRPDLIQVKDKMFFLGLIA
jgi:hypothetical protein